MYKNAHIEISKNEYTYTITVKVFVSELQANASYIEKNLQYNYNSCVFSYISASSLILS